MFKKLLLTAVSAMAINSAMASMSIEERVSRMKTAGASAARIEAVLKTMYGASTVLEFTNALKSDPNNTRGSKNISEALVSGFTKITDTKSKNAALGEVLDMVATKVSKNPLAAAELIEPLYLAVVNPTIDISKLDPANFKALVDNDFKKLETLSPESYKSLVDSGIALAYLYEHYCAVFKEQAEVEKDKITATYDTAYKTFSTSLSTDEDAALKAYDIIVLEKNTRLKVRNKLTLDCERAEILYGKTRSVEEEGEFSKLVEKLIATYNYKLSKSEVNLTPDMMKDLKKLYDDEILDFTKTLKDFDKDKTHGTCYLSATAKKKAFKVNTDAADKAKDDLDKKIQGIIDLKLFK